MKSLNEVFQTFIDNLKKIDEAKAGTIVDKINRQMQTGLQTAEVIIGGSYAKGTDIGVDSDLDLVFVLNPKFTIPPEDELFSKVRKTLKPISTIKPTTPYKATKIKVDGIDIDVLVTKYGTQGTIGEPQQSRRHVREILKQGTLFTNTVRILKFWKSKSVPNATLKSFDLEIILGYVFNNYPTYDFEDALSNFFNYVLDSGLNNQLQFPPSNKAILYRNFDFQNKDSFISACETELKALKKKDLNYFEKKYLPIGMHHGSHSRHSAPDKTSQRYG